MRWSVFGRQHNVIKSNLPLSLNRNVYNQCILTVLTYGSETWSFTKALEINLHITQSGMEKIMLGITWGNNKREHHELGSRRKFKKS